MVEPVSMQTQRFNVVEPLNMRTQHLNVVEPVSMRTQHCFQGQVRGFIL